jgi:hypothetical protein
MPVLCKEFNRAHTKLFFQDILGDVICINLFNNCSNHFRCECESCSTMDTAEERIYSFIGSMSSNDPTFSKYSNMLICSTCRFRQLATHMSCSVMQEISPSSMLMITAEIAWQQMHSFFCCLHSTGILNYFITDFLFGTYKAFFSRHTWRCNLH